MTRTVFRQWFDFLALLTVGLSVVVLTVVIPGQSKTARLKAQRDEMRAEVEAIRRRVDRLVNEMEALQSDPYMIERHLRHNSRFLRPGEHLFEAKSKLPKPKRSD